MNSTISVVIPNYNYGVFLRQALNSVLKQDFEALEVVIVDNFSTDNSRQVVSEFKSGRVSFVEFDNNGSIASARNKGLSLATGDYVAFLDADDYWYNSKLRVQLKAMEGQADISYHNLRLQGKGKFRRFRGWSLGSEPLLDLAAGGNPIATSSVMVKRSALLEVGGFPEDRDLVSAEDYALWLKLADLGYKFLHINKTLGVYLVHSGASSANDNPAKAKALLHSYASKLPADVLKKADGFVAYAKGVRQVNLGDFDLAKESFLESVKFSVGRFRWRAAARLLQLLVLGWTRGGKSSE